MSTNHARIREKNGNWLGDSVGYAGAHIRMRKMFGKANHCEECGATDSSKRYEWANMSGRYHDPSDYKQMCKSCHVKHDIPPEARKAKSSMGGKICQEKRALLPRKTHCPQGHAFALTGFINSSGYRECCICRRASVKRYKAKVRNAHCP
jgi:hypothetical protein